jgi:hypothetical protein
VIASHFVALVAFSSLVSTVFATLLREDLKSRLRFGLLSFTAFVLSAILVGWIMAPFPG